MARVAEFRDAVLAAAPPDCPPSDPKLGDLLQWQADARACCALLQILRARRNARPANLVFTCAALAHGCWVLSRGARLDDVTRRGFGRFRGEVLNELFDSLQRGEAVPQAASPAPPTR